MKKDCGNCEYYQDKYKIVPSISMPCMGCVNDEIDEDLWEYSDWRQIGDEDSNLLRVYTPTVILCEIKDA